tara:strand:- start:2 stop:673 length:672 start_codon:yes stop_codon:yes gene_type:complete
MQKFILVLVILITSISCKQKKETQPEIKILTTAEKIANAYGFENWKNVSQIDFTFNVDRDSSHFERSWKWNPITNDVIMISEKDSVSFNRKQVDSLTMNADKAFINDKYWLLAPFQLVWDKEGTTILGIVKKEAPISKTLMNKITVTYSNKGGYTPGDAYDLYLGDDYMIKEWVYRKENNDTPSLITTWENNQDFNGIKIGLNHIKSEGNWKLYFTNVKVKLN